MLSVILLYVFLFSCVWSWAQNRPDSRLDLLGLISTAAIEWGAILSLALMHFYPARVFNEAPPLSTTEVNPQHIPIIFVPSMHTSASIFNFLIWRLKKNDWYSLWPFHWKFFLNDSELLQDQLFTFISEVIEKTKAQRFRLISFGTSRPIVLKVLNRGDLKAYCDKWIAISSPLKLSSFYSFVSSPKLKKVYGDESLEAKDPDIQIVGEDDFFCQSADHFGNGKKVVVPKIGHFASLLHSSTIQHTLKELSQ